MDRAGPDGVVVEHVEAALDVQRSWRIGIGVASPVVEAIGDIRWRLDFRDEYPGAQRMQGSTWQVIGVSRLDGYPVDALEDRFRPPGHGLAKGCDGHARS